MRPDEYIDSPCFGVCMLDDKNLCVGCRRSEEEIGQWTKYTDEQRESITKELDNR